MNKELSKIFGTFLKDNENKSIQFVCHCVFKIKLRIFKLSNKMKLFYRSFYPENYLKTDYGFVYHYREK